MSEFVLDMDANPHPRMLAGALAARTAAREHPCFAAHCPVVARWQGYLDAMTDATGCTPADLEAWMDRHAVSESGVNRAGA